MSVLRILASVVAVATVTQTAVLKAEAQESVYDCRYVGAPTLEPLGDREGHGLRIVDYSCVVTAGPLSGGVFTARNIYEVDKSGGTLLTGEGVYRKPGAMAVLQATDGKVEYVMSDGKMIAATVTGHSRFVMAVGSWAALSGKATVYSTKPTATGFPIEGKFE